MNSTELFSWCIWSHVDIIRKENTMPSACFHVPLLHKLDATETSFVFPLLDYVDEDDLAI